MKQLRLNMVLYCILMFVCFAHGSIAQTNPFITHMYTADPSAHVWADGRLYVYASHDIAPPKGCDLMDQYHVFSTDDMKHWKDHGEILRAGDVPWGRKEGGFMWAPDCAYKNGIYYFYFPHPAGTDWDKTWKIGVATSKSPAGGFKVQGYINGLDPMIDPCVFVDDDGQAYLYYGGGGTCKAGKLKANMMEVDGQMQRVEGLVDFHEASWVHKRNGIYYLSYSDNNDANGKHNQMRYATSNSPLGPWKYQGIYMDPTDSYTNHGSIVAFKGQWYSFYHNSALSGHDWLRSVCADKLYYNSDGTIRKVVQTKAGAAVATLPAARLRLPALVSDGMVLQREQWLPVWGWARPGAAVAVHFRNKTYTAVTAENGKWSLKLDKYAAGGPYNMTVTSGSDTITVSNILIGDVWLCSGQSNMVFDFNNGRASALYATDRLTSLNSQIRQILVARASSAEPAADCKTTGWKEANPVNLAGFSVAAYFFARDLYEKYKVPVGLINTSFGGTKAEAWTSEEALEPFPRFKNDIAFLKDTAKVNAKIREYQQRIANWHTKNKTEDKGWEGGKPVWAAPELDDKAWKTTKLPALWDTYGYANTYGVFWFRREIELPVTAAGKAGMLLLGSIDDEDETFINGVKIGGYANRTKPREHAIPAGILKAGRNVIAVKVVNYYDQGGMAGDRPMELVLDGQRFSLAGSWKYQQGYVASRLPGAYNPQDLASSLFNGMVAPLIPFAIKGAIWYQGESNSDRAFEYRTLFPAMIKDWRNRWQQGDFPFVFQQLVNFKPVLSQPGESQWAELREAQLMTLAASPNTAMAVGIDIGESDDIHPVNKKEVSYRLSLGARKLAYGERNLLISGPLYQSMKVQGNKVVLRFTQTGSGLQASDGKSLRCFAIAGEDKKFVWANAVIKGNTVEVSAKAISRPVAVRYAWADNPGPVNLFNKEGLPASPFRTDDWPGITFPK